MMLTYACDYGYNEPILLKYTNIYLANHEKGKIITISYMFDFLERHVGLDDIAFGIGAAVAAVAHGATVIEKHFTLSRADGGVDSAFSMEPAELKMLVVETENAWQSLGGVVYGSGEDEQKSLVFRRSLYVAEDMKAGDVFTQENLRCVRPGLGLAPKYYEVLLGMRVNRDVKRGTAVEWRMVMGGDIN